MAHWEANGTKLLTLSQYYSPMIVMTNRLAPP